MRPRRMTAVARRRRLAAEAYARRRIAARRTTAEVLIGASVQVRNDRIAVAAQADVRRTRLDDVRAADHPFLRNGIRAEGLDGVAMAVGLLTVGVSHQIGEV